jgi:hypothetical protein
MRQFFVEISVILARENAVAAGEFGSVAEFKRQALKSANLWKPTSRRSKKTCGKNLKPSPNENLLSYR